MIIPALTAALLLSPQEPLPIAPPEALEGLNVEVQVQVTETHFIAQNRSAIEQWLLFGTLEDPAVSKIRLAPGAAVCHRFPRGSADELRLEVVGVSPVGMWNTGAMALSAIRESDSGALWVTRDVEHSLGWLHAGGSLVHAVPSGTLCPMAWIRAGGVGMHEYSRSGGVYAAAHVPGVTPRRVKSKRPKIKRRPLPVF